MARSSKKDDAKKIMRPVGTRLVKVPPQTAKPPLQTPLPEGSDKPAKKNEVDTIKKKSKDYFC